MRIKDYGDKANQDVAERLVPMALSTILILQQLQLHSHIGRFGVSKEKAGLPETLLLKRLEGGSVEEVARWDLRLILTQFMAGHPKS